MDLFGKFTRNGEEYTIDNPNTPRSFDNFLWNDAVFSNVSHTGAGYFDYQVGGAEAIQLLTGNGRVCDFDVFGRESLMSRLVYVRDNATGVFWNVNWEPVCRPYTAYRCAHGMGYSSIVNETDGIEAELFIFVPDGNDPVELWKLRIKNKRDASADLSLFTYNQFQFRYKWGFDSYGDMLYRSCGFDEELNAVVASKHPHVKPHEYLTGFLAADYPVSGFDGSRDSFVGVYGNLANPRRVAQGKAGNVPGSSDATVGVAQMDLVLKPGEEKSIEMILGAADGRERVRSTEDKYFGNFERYYNEMTAAKKRVFDKNIVKTPDEHLNRMLNYWMKEQSLFGARWCRWGWMGYRDIVQHGLGVSFYLPEWTKEIILEAVKYQYADGTALRGWNPADTKPYSDSALWLCFTLCAYTRETADKELLDTVRPYYDDGSATVLEHIETALDFLENHKGSHGLCLIKFGDWNDSLTAVGRQGRGESVWLSLAYGEALLQISELYEFLGDAGKKEDALKRYETIKDAVNGTAWDGDWYARCFDDNGQAVGGAECEEGKIFIEPQAWALISRIAPPERAAALLKSCDDMLLTPQGYRLLTPTFTKRDDRIGRISTLEPGICENGTIYSHCNSWMILGLLRNGYNEKAYEIFKKITPGYYSGEEDKKRNCPPFVYANCYYGPDHKNNAYQMEFTWITGSISWFNTVMAGEFLGVYAGYDGLRISPRVPAEWDGFTYSREYRNARYDVKVKRIPDARAGHFEMTVDGVPARGGNVPDFRDGKAHAVEVLIG